MSKVNPLNQKNRRPCLLPLGDADLSLGNANWTKGLQARSDWTWGSHQNPSAFPNNLARYFLQIPGIFEQQLNYSTTLIFDKPSYRNGVQTSGFLDRGLRELVINFIAQKRRCWYSMTHHAILGRLTTKEAGVDEQTFVKKWVDLDNYQAHTKDYSAVELALLRFAEAFITNPKAYSDEDFGQLKQALYDYNQQHYAENEKVQLALKQAREAHTKAVHDGLSKKQQVKLGSDAKKTVPDTLPDALNEQKINAQLVELAFLCLQFVALTAVFTGLNIHDEDFIGDAMTQLLPSRVIAAINHLNQIQESGMDSLLPPAVDVPLEAILAGKVTVDPVPLKGARLPLISYEDPAYVDRDKGLTVGGVQVGVYGWGFGMHFPGSLVYALMHHPELARFEAPYSLPVLFNEDEWRGGVQTAGFATRLLKEVVIQRIYKLNRSRYGIEHHTMFLHNAYRAAYGQVDSANQSAIYSHDYTKAPKGTYTKTELAAMKWTTTLLENPHHAHFDEDDLRLALHADNAEQLRAGTRLESDVAQLLHHQVAELAMMIGHMDGLGRAMTMLRLEAEDPVQIAKGQVTEQGGLKPELDAQGQLQLTGYHNNRPGLHQVLQVTGVNTALFTVQELLLNPVLNQQIKSALADGNRIHIDAKTAGKTAEF